MEPKVEHFHTDLPTEAVSYVCLDYQPPPKFGILPQRMQRLTTPVRTRYAQQINEAMYIALEPMSHEEAHEWTRRKAEQLEEV